MICFGFEVSRHTFAGFGNNNRRIQIPDLSQEAEFLIDLVSKMWDFELFDDKDHIQQLDCLTVRCHSLCLDKHATSEVTIVDNNGYEVTFADILYGDRPFGRYLVITANSEQAFISITTMLKILL